MSPESSLSVIEPSLKDSAPKSKISLPPNANIDWLIAGGVSSEEVATVNENIRRAKEITDAFERAMGFNPLPWTERNFDKLRRFLLTKTIQEISAFAVWSRRDFSVLSPSRARMNPQLVIDLWPQAFLPSQPQKSKPSNGNRSEFFEKLSRA